jgi:hypothetical protein
MPPDARSPPGLTSPARSCPAPASSPARRCTAAGRGADLHGTTAPSDPLDRPGDGQGHWHFLGFRAAHLAGAPTAAAPAAHLQALARSELATKLTNIVGLYIDPPAHAVMLSIDERSQIQALDPRCSNRSAGSAKRALSSSVAKAPLDQIAQFYAINLARSSEHGSLVSGGTESSQTRPWSEPDSNCRSRSCKGLCCWPAIQEAGTKPKPVNVGSEAQMAPPPPGALSSRFLLGGPRVRIRLPPAVSRLRT